MTPSQTVLDEIELEMATNSQLVSPESEQDDAMGNPSRRDTSNSLSPNDRQSFAQRIGLRRRSVLTQPPSTPPLPTYDQGSYFKLFSGQKPEKTDSRLGRLRELYRDVKIRECALISLSLSDFAKPFRPLTNEPSL
jgi:hypothetical protein